MQLDLILNDALCMPFPKAPWKVGCILKEPIPNYIGLIFKKLISNIVVYCGLVGLEVRHGTPVPCRYSDTKAFSILTTKACAIVYT